MSVKTAKDAVKFAAENKAEMVDYKFSDMLGTWQHFTTPMSEFEEAVFEEGLGFDGSSIRGWKAINASDMLVVPDPASARMDPFMERPTLSLICDIEDPLTREKYDRDPRNIAIKAVNFLKSTGIADTVYFGPEAEFYLFDSARYKTGPNSSVYEVDSAEGAWNMGNEYEEDGSRNRGYKTRFKGGYFPVSPVDQFADLRDQMVVKLGEVGLQVERSHHEVGTAGQMEINYTFNTLTHAADEVMLFKYIIKNTAWAGGKTVTFMPKPLFQDNGSGMHCHQSLWKDGKPLFYDEAGYGGLSDVARWYIGGLLHHAPSLLAFTNPSVNSYHRLVPGYEAPVNLVYSAGNRSAAIRIPMTGTNPKAKRIEFRAPDASGNPYLAFAAMLMAGLDGIKNRI